MKNKCSIKHVSIRVPWHDNGWNGCVCNKPKLNSACLILDRIAENRNDEKEERFAGHSIESLDEDNMPCCIQEKGMFMANFEYTQKINHPYIKTSKETHGHMDETILRHPPYSAALIPYNWMCCRKDKKYRKEYFEKFKNTFDIDINQDYEPKLTFPTSWIQEKKNQKPILDCFSNHLEPTKSLCFFYAKQVPFVEKYGRILIGVGKINDIGELTEYYKGILNTSCTLT